VERITLTSRQYCVIVNPVDRKLVIGAKSLFLLPGKSLPDGIQNVIELGEDEALVVKAKEQFRDDVSIATRLPNLNFKLNLSLAYLRL